ncbi:hypothetical protein DFH11DRAFT_1766669 [Phellopilus nigrolimitatus]|nr:hypothetical protein DFH11DRAFT_1766669 [Phellopilus nigrolimitatus]
MKAKKFVGTFIDTPELGSVRILHNHSLVVSEEGFILSFGTHDVEDPAQPEIEIIRIPSGSFMLPSFCDLHLHAPQFLYQGTGLHLPLMEWLDQYAFRAEERIDADPALAATHHGTGAVLLFGTIKEESNLILADVMQSAGIRAFVGKLSMDISSRKTYIEASASRSLDAAKSFVTSARATVSHLSPHERLIEPVLTPRFVPTCSDELLSGLGKLSVQEGVRVQSHLAEARDQVDWVERERGMADIDVFDNHNLLNSRTIQAHCTFLGEPSLARLAARGTAVAHCPLSNAYFSAKPFPLREALAAGVHVGLGTDVAGGYSIDLMNAMRNTVLVSRMREGARSEAEQGANQAGLNSGGGTNEQDNDGSVNVNWKEALFLATRGGAVALGLSVGAGAFEVSAPFDAQLIQLFDSRDGQGIGSLDFFEIISATRPITEEMLEKWWCIGDTRNRIELWVQGRKCFPR